MAFQARSSPSKKSGPFKVHNIIKMMEKRQNGDLKASRFKLNITKLKAQALRRSFEEFEIDPYLFNCKFLKSSHAGCLIGVWQKVIEPNKKHSIVYHMKFEYSLKNQVEDGPMVSELSCCGPFDKRLDITDSCEQSTQGRTSLLYVGNTAIQSGRIILNVNNPDSYDDIQPELIWYSEKRLFSCSNNVLKERFAIGSEKEFILCDSFSFFHTQRSTGDVLAVEFSKNGNILYCGVENESLTFYDLREPMRDAEGYTIGTCAGVKGVKDIKLLCDDWTVIASVLDGRMFRLDLRMRKPVFTFPGYCNKAERRPLSIDEDLDIVCATGDDNHSRLWSMTSGELLRTIEPLHQKTNTQACLISGQRKWFLALVQDNILTPVLHYVV